MFVKKDPRKIKQILEDPEDDCKILFIARRAGEFPMGCIKNVLCRSRQVAALKELEHLSLYSNNLVSISGIGKLNTTSIVSLDIGKNLISEIPEEIRDLTTLCSFVCEDNQLDEFPKAILSLHNLTTLRLSGNKIKDIPLAIADLGLLQTLALDNNEIETIPREIKDLQLLEHLILRGNRIRTLPSEMGELGQLVTLVLSSNKLESFIDVGNWYSLELLLLNGNCLVTFPESILLLNDCRINIANNFIMEFPADIGETFTNINISGQQESVPLSKARAPLDSNEENENSMEISNK